MAKVSEKAKAIAYQVYVKQQPLSGRGLFDCITEYLNNYSIVTDELLLSDDDIRTLRSLSIDDCTALFRYFKPNDEYLSEKKENLGFKYVTNDAQVIAFLKTCNIKPIDFKIKTTTDKQRTVFFIYKKTKDLIGLVKMFDEYAIKVEPRRYIKEYKYAIWESKQILKHPDWTLTQ